MTKEVFLKQLRDCLNQRNVRGQSAEVYLRRFEKILDDTPADKIEQRIVSFGRPDELAARISQQLHAEEGEHAGPSSQKAPQKPAAPSAPSVPKAAPSRPAPGQSRPVSAGQSNAANPGVKNAPPPRSAAPKSAKPTRSSSHRDGQYDAPMSPKGKQVFWWSLALTSPIWGFILCAVAAVFLLAYLAIILLAILLVVGEVVLVVGGVLVAVIGIVYGVMQMLPGAEASYIGLYELGLGIRNGGITMLVSILVYNLVVNLTPIALKQLTRFAKFTAKKLWQLLLFIRKECGKL